MFLANRIVLLLCLVLSVAIFSCRPEKVCSGLNPETGKYNTHKRLRKGGKGLSSKPERNSLRHRKQMMKKKREFSAKGRYGGGFHIFGGSAHASVSAGGSSNMQKN